MNPLPNARRPDFSEVVDAVVEFVDRDIGPLAGASGAGVDPVERVDRVIEPNNGAPPANNGDGLKPTFVDRVDRVLEFQDGVTEAAPPGGAPA